VGREAASRGVVLHSELDGLRWCAPPFFEGDRGLLQQALVNLLVNAIQASPRGAEVQLGAATTESGLEIVVQDQGSGIAEEDLSRVFDPFFTTKSVGEGSGLGLSISLGIVERHGGTLTVQNRSAGGVSARILLPSSVSEPATDYLSLTGSQ
jgi:two-component system NtrC family sensor kinase